MKFNKIMAKTLVFALALGSLSFVGTPKTRTFAAATAATFSGVSGKITSENGTHWGVAKKLKTAPKKAAANVLKKSSTEIYQVKALEPLVGKEIDLGKYKGKNVIIVVGQAADFSTPADWTVVDIKAGDKGFKAYYSMEEAKAGKIKTDAADTFGGTFGFLSFFAGKKQIPIATAKTDVEVKTAGGDWQLATAYLGADLADDAVNKKLNVLTQRGAKLTFRLKGGSDKWPSKESKVSIAGQKKGPSVKLDIDKETSNLKKDYLYAISLSNADTPSIENVAKGKDDFTKLGIDKAYNVNDQILYVQEPKGKKLASKVTKITVKRQQPPTLNQAIGGKVDGQGKAIIEGKVRFDLAVAYDTKKGAFVTNADPAQDYEFFVDYDGTQADKVKKWVKLKKAASAENHTKVKIAFSSTKKNNAYGASNSKIYVRLPGKKQIGNEVTLPSTQIAATIEVKNIEQKMTITTVKDDSFDITKPEDKAFTLKFNKSEEKEYNLKAKITNVTKQSGKPKLKIVSPGPSGVKVSVDEMTSDTNSLDVIFGINIKITDKAFSADPKGTMKFAIEHESVVQEYTVTFATP